MEQILLHHITFPDYFLYGAESSPFLPEKESETAKRILISLNKESKIWKQKRNEDSSP